MSTPPSSDLKAMPSMIVKNIRAVAALVCYDMVARQKHMSLQNQYLFCYDAFHGNPAQNIPSQIELLLRAHRTYSPLFHVETPPPGADGGPVLVLKERYCRSYHRFISDVHFNKASLSAPTKARMTEKITGRNIYDLASLTLRNVQKACARAEEWMDDDGSPPPGGTWPDLYERLLSEDIGSEKGPYTGWIAFEILTRYNDGGKHALSILEKSKTEKKTSHEGTSHEGTSHEGTSHGGPRKKMKLRDEGERSGTVMGDLAGHLPLATRVRLIEMAQAEDSKKNHKTELTIAHANFAQQMLLDERKQAIELAQTICPKYDSTNEFWISVNALTLEIEAQKRKIRGLTNARELRQKDMDKSTVMAETLLRVLTPEASITKTEISAISPKQKMPSEKGQPSNDTGNKSATSPTIEDGGNIVSSDEHKPSLT